MTDPDDFDRRATLRWINEWRAHYGMEPIEAIRPWLGCYCPVEASFRPLRSRINGTTIWFYPANSHVLQPVMPAPVYRFVQAIDAGRHPDLGSIEDGDCPRDVHISRCPESVVRTRLRPQGPT